MSMLVRAVALRQVGKAGIRSISASANKLLHNYDDFKPGPKPKTREEHEAAAKKYNLHPSEYQPYPDDDGLGRGDYPKLPDISVEDRDPFYPYDDPALKRNFQEPVHAHIDLISEDRYNISMRPRYSNRQMIASFFGLMALCTAIYLALEPFPIFRPVMEKQMPKKGVIHYTFESNDS